MRPSAISVSMVSRAISRRTPSNAERTTACGVSSMMTSTPVRFSRARMLRPSRPMIRPFRSSEASWTTETVVSAVWPDAVRWMATDRMFRARLSASSRASSSMRRTSFAMSPRHSSSILALSRGHSGDLLELGDLGIAGDLQLLLELLGVDLAVGDRLLAPGQLFERRLELDLVRGQALFDLDDLGAPLGEIAFLLRALGEQLLARRDARLLHLGVRLALRVLQDPLRLPPGVTDPAAAAAVFDQDAGARSAGEGERDQHRLHRDSLCTCRRHAGGGDQISLPTRPPPPHRGVPRLGPSPPQATKGGRELIEDAIRCMQTRSFAGERTTTPARPDSQEMVVDR